MAYRLHLFPGLVILAFSLVIQFQVYSWLLKRVRRPAWVHIAHAVCVIWVTLAYLLGFARVVRHFSPDTACWIDASALVWAACLAGFYCGAVVWRRASRFENSRRGFLKTAAAGLCVAPLAGIGFGIAERVRFQLTEVDIPMPGLPKALHGLRIVQITDPHLSPFLSEREFARAIDMANETGADLALMTGDLISRPGDPLDACLRQLARLRAEAGVLGCLGNHETYTRTEDYVEREGRRIGIDVLRNRARVLWFNGTPINFAGVDYQMMHAGYLPGAEGLVQPGMLNVMLSHNPDVFPVAARKGYALTIAGHTHGGQVNFEILHQNLNAARYFTPYVRGLYRENGAAVYVSAGLGTIGVPVRLGAPPEVSLVRLCAI